MSADRVQVRFTFVANAMSARGNPEVFSLRISCGVFFAALSLHGGVPASLGTADLCHGGFDCVGDIGVGDNIVGDFHQGGRPQ
jgi:hypothetical protein